MYQTGGTIKELLDDIKQSRFVLPAIQREFVWQPEQIARLFDSLMQGYPFGTFLYWKVDRQNSGLYTFYGFVRDYHQRDNPHCPQLSQFHNTDLTAVLDGQQRITALNIGLCGSMALRLPNKWRNNPNAYPLKHLYVDLLATHGDADDAGERYRFEFLTRERADTPTPNECWFKVADILGMEDGPPMLAWLNEKLPQEQLNQAYAVLHKLYQVVHIQKVIAFYEEKSQNLEKVLNVFIRMNSGGTILSYSDLLLSIAVAQWSADARTQIYSLVDELNDTGGGFGFSKDFVLKAGLMLADIGSVGFKVENFNRANMEVLEREWPQVQRSLMVAVQLLASFGFTEKSLRADSAVLPIAYYIRKRGLDSGFVTKSRYASDRQSIRLWLTRSLLKISGIWGSGLDTLLAAVREVINEHGSDGFPAEHLYEVMAKRGKGLLFTESEIDELVEMQYGDKRLFCILTVLFHFVDVANNQFHVDHVFPIARFNRSQLRRAGVDDGVCDAFKDMANTLPNLQLLEGLENLAKRATLPLEWMRETMPASAKSNYCDNHLLGEVPDKINDFQEFYDRRREAMKSRLASLLGNSGE